jgi:replicative DNA helicase
MFDQLPPHDVAAEEAVLGSLMVADDVAALVAPIVSARDFYREHNAWCFEACMALWERGESINQVTVAHELERRGRLDDAGGLSYISDLINDLPTPVGVEHSAAIVKRDAMYRRMLTAAVDMAQLAYEAGSDFNGALARAEALVYGLRRRRTTARERCRRCIAACATSTRSSWAAGR